MDKRPVDDGADGEQTSKKPKIDEPSPTVDEDEIEQEKDDSPQTGDIEEKTEEKTGEKESSAETNGEGGKDAEQDRKDMHARLMEEESKFDSCFMSFPEKLMSLLNSEEVKECMWWLNEGDSFCLEPAGFAEKVLDKHFQGTKFESFTRKLNRWGFKRVAGQKVPPKAIAYYHHCFHKDKPELVKEMSGSRNRVMAGRDKKNAGTDPRFQDLESFMAMKQHAEHSRATDMLLARQREAMEFQRLRGMNDPGMMFPYHMMMGHHDMSGGFPMEMMPQAMGMPPHHGHPGPHGVAPPSGGQGPRSHGGESSEHPQPLPVGGSAPTGEPMDQRLLQMYLTQQRSGPGGTSRSS